jgi:hypothetical protein
MGIEGLTMLSLTNTTTTREEVWRALRRAHSRRLREHSHLGPLQRELAVVFRGLDGAGDERVPAIGADDQVPLLRDGGACLGAAANAGDPVAIPQ